MLRQFLWLVIRCLSLDHYCRWRAATFRPIYSSLMAFDQVYIFYRAIYLLWHGNSLYPVLFERPPRLIASCDKPGVLRTITGFDIELNSFKSLHFLWTTVTYYKFIQISLLRYHCLQLFTIKLLPSLSFFKFIWWVLVLFLS